MADDFGVQLKSIPYPSFESVALKKTTGGVEKFKDMIRSVVSKLK